MLNVALYLLTLTQLFRQTDAGTCVQSTSVLEKNSTGSVELELDDGKPLPTFPNNIYPFPSFERDTNPHNGTSTVFQPAAVQPILIKGVHDFSRTSPFAVGTNMLETMSGNKSETCLNLERKRNHPEVNNENRKVVQESKTILQIDEDACAFDLTSKNQKILNIGLDEKFLDREGDFPTHLFVVD